MSGVRRLVVAALVLPIRAYQLLVSPLLGPRCRFYPSRPGRSSGGSGVIFTAADTPGLTPSPGRSWPCRGYSSHQRLAIAVKSARPGVTQTHRFSLRICLKPRL